MIETNLNATQDLFQLHPIRSLRKVSGGSAPVPYHVYNGTVLLIGGTADLDSVRALLVDEDLEPICTTRGDAFISLWLCNFNQSSLGPHKILYSGISVALEALPPLKPRPLALLDAILMKPQVGIYWRRAWMDDARAAIYQSELLGLDVYLAQGGYTQDPDRRIMEFEFWEVSEGETLLSGHVRERAYTTPRPALALLRRLGLSGFLQVTRQPKFSLRVVAPCRGGDSGSALSERISQIYWQGHHAVTQYFNPQNDRLFLSNAVYPDIEFHPQFVERLEGFKMVYLPPGKSKE
jgi:hypothetical protein